MKKNQKNEVVLNQRELEVFSDELLNEFQMMETYGGLADTNINCTCKIVVYNRCSTK